MKSRIHHLILGGLVTMALTAVVAYYASSPQ